MKGHPFLTWKGHAGLTFICLLFLAAGILRLNDLSLYTPDSTRYVIWGNSLAHGEGFLDSTQPDADRYVIHAPLYALLLAPIEFFFPLSLIAVKLWTLLWGIVAIVLFYIWLYPFLGKTASLIGALLFSFNPMILLYSTEALSETPFIALVILTFIMCEKIAAAQERSRMNLIFLLVSVAAVALMREVGVAMIIAAVVYFLLRKQPKRAAAILLFSFVLLCLWYVRNQIIVGVSPGSQRGNLSLIFQHFVTPSDASIVNELALRMWLNFKEYFSQLGGMLFYPLFATNQTHLYTDISPFYKMLQLIFEDGKFIVVLLSGFLMFSGLYVDTRTSKAAVLRLCFVVFYLGLIFAYPVHDIRFLVPLLPLMILYIVLALRWYVREQVKLFSNLRQQHAVVIALVLLIPNFTGIFQVLKTNIAYQTSPLGFYKSLEGLTNYPPIFTQPWTLFGRWIQSNIPEEETIASPSKELAIVVGNRKVMELDPGLPLPLFEKLLRDNRVHYVLAPVRWQDLKVYEFLMNESTRFWFEPVYKVSNLILIKIHPRFIEPVVAGQRSMELSDTTSASGLLRKGRREIMEEHYDEAIRSLSNGLTLAPQQPQLVYQLVLAYALKGDVENSVKQYRSFITLPQVGSYIVLARFQIQAMELFHKAQSLPNPEERSLKMFDVASTYWKSGYYRRAASILDVSLDADSSYFVGLLWGFHYAFQLGDTSRAFHYLRQLERLDAVNPVVIAFERTRSIYDSLEHGQTSVERSRLHLSLARIYSTMELNEESLDEAEKALGENRKNVEAHMFIAETFEHRSLFRSAQQWYKQILLLEPENTIARSRVDSLAIRFPRQ